MTKEPREWATALRETLESLREKTQTIREALADGRLSLKDQVELGQALWRISASASGALGPIKDSLRSEALKRSQNRPGPQFLHGRSGDARCTVTIPGAQLMLREGIGEAELREALGDRFDRLFRVTTTVVPVKSFQEQASAESPELQDALGHLIDTKSDPPRVTFND